MALTTINVNLPTLANNGRIQVIALDAVTDGTAIYPKGELIASAPISLSGTATLAIPDTEATGQRVQFRIEKGTADPRTLIDVFDRIIPASGTAIPLSTLIDSYYAPSMIDSSNLAIANLLAANPVFLASVPGFNELTWTSAQNFKLGDYTWRGDGLYRGISPSQGSNKDPLVAANVMPSVNAVWEKKITLPQGAQPNLANTWTAKQNFSAGASALTAALGTSNTDVATNEFVQSALASGGSLLPAPIYWSRLAANLSPANNVWGTIPWDSTVVGSSTSGVITLPASGRYLAICQLSIRLSSTAAGLAGRLFSRAALFQNGIESGDLIQMSVAEVNGTYDNRPTGIKPFTATAGDQISVRFSWTGANTSGTPSGSLQGAVAQNYFMLFRMA